MGRSVAASCRRQPMSVACWKDMYAARELRAADTNSSVAWTRQPPCEVAHCESRTALAQLAGFRVDDSASSEDDGVPLVAGVGEIGAAEVDEGVADVSSFQPKADKILDCV